MAGRKTVAAVVERAGIVVELPEKDLRPAGCKRWMRRTMAKHFPAVVKGYLEQMPKSSCQHLKLILLLLEETGKKRRKKGVLEGILEDLKRDEAGRARG